MAATGLAFATGLALATGLAFATCAGVGLATAAVTGELVALLSATVPGSQADSRRTTGTNASRSPLLSRCTPSRYTQTHDFAPLLLLA